VAIIGSAIESGGGLIALPFLAFIGATEWLYLLPATWWLRRRGRTAIAKGVLIGGSLVLLLSTLCYGGIMLASLGNYAEMRRIQQYEREHPTDYLNTDGVVTLVDDTHFEFRREDGTMVSLLTSPGQEYVFLKKDGGYEIKTREMLKPGVRVSVEYSQERGKPPISASIVRVYEVGRVK
jgi:hypothetical protein